MRALFRHNYLYVTVIYTVNNVSLNILIIKYSVLCSTVSFIWYLLLNLIILIKECRITTTYDISMISSDTNVI